jgi:cytidylate kinase
MHMSAITISRELGTDAPTIAHLVADMVGYEWLDKALIREVARVADVPEAEVERFDEVGERPFIRFLKDLLEPGGSASYGAWWASEFPGGMIASALPPIEEEGGEAPILDHERYKDLVRTVMARLADRGDVVIVGRGGQVLLKGRRDVLSVRLVAPLEFRKQVVVAREKIDAEAAADLIRKTDIVRQRYIQNLAGEDWGNPALYHLILNVQNTGTEGAAKIIAHAAWELLGQD